MEECRQEVIYLHCRTVALNCWYAAGTLDVVAAGVNDAVEEVEGDVGCGKEVAVVVVAVAEVAVGMALPLFVVEEEVEEMAHHLDDVLQLHTCNV